MPYKLVLLHSFTKRFNKLPQAVKEQILKGLEKASFEPYAGTKLQGKLSGLWRWRVGKYRVVYMIDGKENAIVFLDVGLRKSIYE